MAHLIPFLDAEKATRLNYVNNDVDFTVEAYMDSRIKNYFCILSYFLTAGITFMVFHWKPDWWIKSSKKLTGNDA